MICTGRKESKRLLPVGRVLATQFYPRKVAAIDTAPKGRNAIAVPLLCQKQELGLAHIAFMWSDLKRHNYNSRHFHCRRLSHFNLAFKIPVSPSPTISNHGILNLTLMSEETKNHTTHFLLHCLYVEIN